MQLTAVLEQLRTGLRNMIPVIVMLLAAGFVLPSPVDAREPPSATVTISALPPEARTTLELIGLGGPFRYRQDGAVFGNREHLLPPRPRGYYHEYTVPTPGARNRGARRFVSGRDGEYYYSDDHYQDFRLVQKR